MIEQAPIAPHEQPKKQDARRASIVSNIIAIIGFIVLVVIIVWGLINLLSLGAPWLSDAYDWVRGKDSEIEITAPAQATSGMIFSISWEHESDEAGAYALLYECAEGLQLGIPNEGGTYSALPCGTSVTLGDATTTLSILPLLVDTQLEQLILSVIYIPADAENSEASASGSAEISVKGTSAPRPVATTTPPVTTPPTTRPPVTTPTPRPTAPDLKVSIVAVGVIDPYTGKIAQRAPNGPHEIMGVQFDIANIGGSASGSYYFTAMLPTARTFTYISPTQASLAPGAHVLNTLRFDQATAGMVVVHVDPANTVKESNESNNAVSRSISGQYYPTYYQNYQPYQSYWY